jgi:hypothetical protein
MKILLRRLRQKQRISSKNKKMTQYILNILLLSGLFKSVVHAQSCWGLPFFELGNQLVFFLDFKRLDEAAHYIPGNTKDAFKSPVIKLGNTYLAPVLTGFLPPHNKRNILLTFKTKLYV